MGIGRTTGSHDCGAFPCKGNQPLHAILHSAGSSKNALSNFRPWTKKNPPSPPPEHTAVLSALPKQKLTAVEQPGVIFSLLLLL